MRVMIGALLITIISCPLRAQESKSGDITGRSVKYEVSLHMGPLLPDQIPNVTEILPTWGAGVGIRAGDGILEVGGTISRGRGVEFYSTAMSYRIDLPLQGLVAHFLFGPDFHSYQAADRVKKSFGGGHLGGGVLTLISENLWFRSDMKFNVNPGYSLYIGFGFMLRWQ